MSVFGPVVLLAVCLGLQAGLARLAPQSAEYVDLMILPVIWYALTRSQRSAMVIGCVAGLTQDAWLQASVFGMSGFCKTFLGWVLGALATRFDLNNPTSRFVTGLVFALSHNLLEIGLRRLLDQVTTPPNLWSWIAEGLISGLVIVVGFALIRRVGGGRDTRAPAGWRA